MFFGLVYAVKKHPSTTSEDRMRLDELVSTKVKDASGKVSLTKFGELGSMVAYCSVWQGKKASGVNLLMRGTEGDEVGLIIERHLMREGQRDWDPAPGKPVVKELRDALRKSRGKGGGKGQ